MHYVTLPTERVSWNDVKRKNCKHKRVTLPTERVSWNIEYGHKVYTTGGSRSPRSVWVEIFLLPFPRNMILVTLPTERVSWNYFMYSNRIFYESHAPHGACELKSPMTHWQADKSKSRSPRSVWVEIWKGRKTVKNKDLLRSPRSVWVGTSGCRPV